jgi:methylmalonyl-CoA mutase
LAASVISRRRVLTGANRFANPAEQAWERVGGAIVHDPVRAALPFEELRMRTERYARQSGKLPRIVLAEIGDPKMRSARSAFAADFFACAGLSTQILQFETPRQIAAAAADLLVICSSDPEYQSIATQLLSELNAVASPTPVVIAGNPEGAEQLRAAGITEFVHLRSNPIEVLASLQQLLGMA